MRGVLTENAMRACGCSKLRNAKKAQRLQSRRHTVVATATFRLLYIVIVLGHDRRRIIHFNVTQSPRSGLHIK